ncbi:MAG: hypothetical protein JXQ97_11300 [Natronospirillum sp.]
MRIITWTACVLALLFAYSGVTQSNTGQEVIVGEWREDITTLDELRDQRQYPSVNLVVECDSVGDCPPQLVNHDGRVLRSYPSRYEISTVAAGRHADQAFLLYRRAIPVYRDDEETFNVSYWLINDQGVRREFSPRSSTTSINSILPDGSLLQVTNENATRADHQGRRETLITFPEGVRDFTVTTGLNSQVAIVLRLDDDTLWACSLSSCADSGISLSARGDRSEILSVYPRTEHQLYLVAYKYINAYNKGLYGAEVDLSTEHRQHGWLAHSMDRNLGFSPQVMVVDDDIIVQARNTTQRQTFALHHPVDSWANALNPWPDLPAQFNRESFFELQASSGVQRVNSVMWNSVEFKDDLNSGRHSRVNYELEPGWGTLFALEGRVGGRYLALSYLQQLDDRIAKASRWLSLVLDLNRLGEMSDSQTGLRFELDRAELWGAADTRLPGERQSFDDITIERLRMALYATMERGLYYGLSYQRQTQPAVVGFSNQQQDIVYSTFVPDLTVNLVQLHVGYDQLAYSRRYETNYNAFYIDGNAGFGMGWITDGGDIGDAALAEVTQTREERVPLFGASFNAELGYQVQRRSSRLWGAGISAQAGYRASGYVFGQGQGEESEIESYEITRELSITGFQHGPFATLSLIF